MTSALHDKTLASELGIATRQVSATLELLDDGATVPFLARYRKEVTGGLDEFVITSIRDRVAQLRELDKRRGVIVASLEEQGKLTDSLKEQVEAATTMTELEDLYLPYRPKRRTRALIAKERGLEPLAQSLWVQDPKLDVVGEAGKFLKVEQSVESVDDALAGARDIMAEWINEDQQARASMRALFLEQGMFKTTGARGKDVEASKYRDYAEWEEPVANAPSHRVLAMRRGEQEGFLNFRVLVPEASAFGVAASPLIDREQSCGGSGVRETPLALSQARRLERLHHDTQIAAEADEISCVSPTESTLLTTGLQNSARMRSTVP